MTDPREVVARIVIEEIGDLPLCYDVERDVEHGETLLYLSVRLFALGQDGRPRYLGRVSSELAFTDEMFRTFHAPEAEVRLCIRAAIDDATTQGQVGELLGALREAAP